MIIGIGTENPVKIKACKAAFQKLRHKLNASGAPQFIMRHSPSNVSEMPLSAEEMMDGAKNRAINLFNALQSESILTDYTIGLEGGLMNPLSPAVNSPDFFLQSWVYVYNGMNGYWGSSGALSVPENIYKPIVQCNEELASIIDQISGQINVRENMGAVGILTDGVVNRQQFFETALEFAFAPFYNQKLYQ